METDISQFFWELIVFKQQLEFDVIPAGVFDTGKKDHHNAHTKQSNPLFVSVVEKEICWNKGTIITGLFGKNTDKRGDYLEIINKIPSRWCQKKLIKTVRLKELLWIGS